MPKTFLMQNMLTRLPGLSAELPIFYNKPKERLTFPFSWLSSSERDLAYPLNIREVSAEYKITTPLMAVQAQDSLVALMWKVDYEWADGEKYPSARFLVQSNKTDIEAEIAAKVGLIDTEQMWWWKEEWQEGEREVENNFAKGEVTEAFTLSIHRQ